MTTTIGKAMQQLVTVQEREKPKKLSELFRLAAKELTQVRGYYGKRSTRQACALGAISYYWDKPSGHDELYASLYGGRSAENKRQLESFVHHLDMEYDAGMSTLNDRGWIFERFAEEAEAIGL